MLIFCRIFFLFIFVSCSFGSSLLQEAEVALEEIEGIPEPILTNEKDLDETLEIIESDDDIDKTILENTNETLSNFTLDALEDGKNETESKITCVLRVLPEGEAPQVQIVNSSKLLENLTPLPNITTGECAMVLFYSPWCPFSGNTAPYFNALPRAFPHIPHYAIDVITHYSLQMKYGLVAVPTLYLFHNGRAVARFNDSNAPSLGKFINFVQRLTGLNGVDGVTVISEDMMGPVPSITEPRRDYNLVAAWAFTIFCIFLVFAKSRVCKSIVEAVQITWREAQHEHLD